MHPPLPLNQPAKGRPNPLNPYIEGVSNGASRAFFYKHDDRGARCHRHLERSRMPLWEIGKNRSHDALSREISHLNASCTMVA